MSKKSYTHIGIAITPEVKDVNDVFREKDVFVQLPCGCHKEYVGPLPNQEDGPCKHGNYFIRYL